MTFLSCYRLSSACKYFCPYFIGRFAKIYLWKTVVCLFCLLSWDLPNHGTFWYHWKALNEQGCIKLVTQFSTYGEKTIEYWEKKFIEHSFKSKLNFIWEFGHALGMIGKPSMGKDLMKVILKLLDLRCLRHWILNSYCP
jgi:hypothetical protein